MIDLRCCDVAEILAEASGAQLVHADPPWVYENAAVGGNADDQYPTLTLPRIVEHIDAAFDCAADGARLALWTTWPLLVDWLAVSAAMRWQYVTGGSWTKTGTFGVGFHWRGQSEPLLVYRKPGKAKLNRAGLINAHSSRPTGHSEKPHGWQRAMLREWTEPGDLALDIYAGMAPLARACQDENRDYLGAEIDRGRWGDAMERLGVDSGQAGRTVPMFGAGMTAEPTAPEGAERGEG
jgi:hypothetical protein